MGLGGGGGRGRGDASRDVLLEDIGMDEERCRVVAEVVDVDVDDVDVDVSLLLPREKSAVE